ncbi:agmatine deiminase family protein [Morganella morganii]|uniref:agmatine deiminase family protein n=1 Tax=Morganella morganii TaxID=582 RepID=UPI002361AF2A|nr:agmatine deiminase family protein [Morganella morganii]
MFIMPSEHLPHAATWMAFGADASIWSASSAEKVCRNQAALALAIARFEPVNLLVTRKNKKAAQQLMGDAVTYIECPLDDIWLRDSGANFVYDTATKRPAAISFNFNGWGKKQPVKRDAGVAAVMAEYTGLPLHISPLTLEGGAIEVNGSGTGIFTRSAILNDNRNPGISRQQTEQWLSHDLGLKTIIWLNGIRNHDITDAHIDFYARFVSEKSLVIAMENNPQSFEYEVTRDHAASLYAVKQHTNLIDEVHILSNPLTTRVDRMKSPYFAAGYINYYPCNGGIIVPEFGDSAADEQAAQLLAALYPGRVVVQVNIDAIASGGGGIHCVTMQQPDFTSFITDGQTHDIS